MINKFPEIRICHLKRLTDSFAIIQHSTIDVPDIGTGYTTDDNARALIAAIKINGLNASGDASELAEKYSAFLEFAQMPDGWFHNFISGERKQKDKMGSSDSFGRAIWACGTVLGSRHAPKAASVRCREIFEKAKPHISGLEDCQAISYALLGCCEILHSSPHENGISAIANRLSSRLVRNFESQSSDDWKWFEHMLSYCNARMPHALFEAGTVLKNKKFINAAISSFDFLKEKTILDGVLVPIGQNGWYHRGGRRAYYDQQPVDAGAMVEAGISAFNATGNREYWQDALASLSWFFGRNSTGHKMYNPKNSSCYDGLGKDGVNLNQGAESTLAYLLARVSIEEATRKLQI